MLSMFHDYVFITQTSKVKGLDIYIPPFTWTAVYNKKCRTHWKWR